MNPSQHKGKQGKTRGDKPHKPCPVGNTQQRQHRRFNVLALAVAALATTAGHTRQTLAAHTGHQHRPQRQPIPPKRCRLCWGGFVWPA